MRILFLTQWFDPEPTFKGLMFAKALRDRGHEVEVLTGFPNYPGGKLYPGYKVKLFQRERQAGIRVNRVPLFPSHDKSGLKRVANYGSFAMTAATLGQLLVSKPDVIYAFHPPATVGLAAVALRARFGVPLVYEIQDMWPEAIASSGMLGDPRLLALVGAYCKGVYRYCDRIVVLSPGFKQLLEQRGVPSTKIDVVYNWTYELGEPPQRDPAVLARHNLTGRCNVMFAGTMGTGQGLDVVLDAAKLLADKDPTVQFVLVGGGVDRERLTKRVEQEAIANVVILPRQDPQAMAPLLAAADAVIVHLKDDPLFRVTIPSKIQAYLAAARPILIGVQGDAADLVEKARAGYTFVPENAASLADGVERMSRLSADDRTAMGRRGRDFYLENLSVDVGVEHFERVFAAACCKNPSRRTGAQLQQGGRDIGPS